MATLDDLLLIEALAAQRAQRASANLRRYLHDPAGFVRDCVEWPAGGGPTEYQLEILTAIAKHRKVSTRGPHGIAKTATASLALLWFALTREAAGIDWKVITTAGSWRQLEKYLWPEIHKWSRVIRWDLIGRSPFGRHEMQVRGLRLQHGSAIAVASDDPALIEGAHADAILYIFDEAKSIPAAVFDAAEGAFSGGEGTESYALAVSTPGEPSGRFYDIHAGSPVSVIGTQSTSPLSRRSAPDG